MRLMAPMYVKPYVKRQKNTRRRGGDRGGGHPPTMRFVALRAKRARRAMLFRTRDLQVRQRTQTSTRCETWRSSLVAARPRISRRCRRVENPSRCQACAAAKLYLEQIAALSARSPSSEEAPRRGSRRDARLQTMPVAVTRCVAVFAPPMAHFRNARLRRLAGWCRAALHPAPAISKMPARHPPLLITSDARALRAQARQLVLAHAGREEDRMLVAIALANHARAVRC